MGFSTSVGVVFRINIMNIMNMMNIQTAVFKKKAPEINIAVKTLIGYIYWRTVYDVNSHSFNVCFCLFFEHFLIWIPFTVSVFI